MANAGDGDGDMRIDLPARPQFPQGPTRATSLMPPNTGLDTPTTPFSEGESLLSPDDGRRALRSSMTSHYRTLLDDPDSGPLSSDRPPIPSALPISSSDESTPLPKIPMIVLSIVSSFRVMDLVGSHMTSVRRQCLGNS